MGQGNSKGGGGAEAGAVGVRSKAITGGAVKGKATLPKLPSNAVKCGPDEYPFVEVRSAADWLPGAVLGGACCSGLFVTRRALHVCRARVRGAPVQCMSLAA